MAAESRLRRRQRAAAAVGVVAIVEQAGGRTAVVVARVAAALVRVFAILNEGQSQRPIGDQFVVDTPICQPIARRMLHAGTVASGARRGSVGRSAELSGVEGATKTKNRH